MGLKAQLSLAEYQNVLLELLDEFSRFCESNDIKVWLSFGTLLGSVRNGKIIPWDDDIDLEILRDDYNKLLKLSATDKFPRHLKVQCRRTDRGYHASYAKIRMEGKFYVEESGNFRTDSYHYNGPYLDLFVIDKGFPQLIKLGDVLMSIGFSSNIYKYKMFRVIYFSMIHNLFSLVTLLSKYSALKYIYALGSRQGGFVYSKSMIFPLVTNKFNGITVNIPSQSERILELIYGEKWIVPHEPEQRQNHSIKCFHVDL